MSILTGGLGYIIPFLVVLTVLVFVHELGHYLVARRNGVRIEVFSIGFGPEIFGWYDRAGTRWKLSAVPLGGYVKMYGDADASSLPSDSLATMSEIDGHKIERFEDVQQAVRLNAGAAMKIVVRRDGRDVALAVTPQMTEMTD